ncbi:hypothetical protein EJ110_NYTH03597 [Nymphaea thermarum]|nr:hypothetical protein EJ110_NYTH03597 [Nymphaea thermarum]
MPWLLVVPQKLGDILTPVHDRADGDVRELKSWSSGFMVAFLFLCITILTIMGVKRSRSLFGTADIQCIG